MTTVKLQQGKVSRITAWKTGKGYFLNLDGNSNDFYGFGSCKGKVGETVEMEVSEGTGNFADKIRIDKLYSKQTNNEAVKETEDKSMEILNKSIASGENTYFERQNLIIRQTCIKSASRIVSRVVGTDSNWKSQMLIDLSCEIADGLYAWVTESDYKLPEPPEEP